MWVRKEKKQKKKSKHKFPSLPSLFASSMSVKRVRPDSECKRRLAKKNISRMQVLNCFASKK